MLLILKRYLNSHNSALEGLEITDRVGAVIDHDTGFNQFCEMSKEVGSSGRQQYLVRNGTSVAFSNHMAPDWAKNGGVPTQSFSNAALLTAMGNDLGFEEAFSAPLSWYGKSGDLLITISSSGNSVNILKAIKMAGSKSMGVVTVGLKSNNASRRLGDLNF